MPADTQDDVTHHHHHHPQTTTNPPPFLPTLSAVFSSSLHTLTSHPKLFSSLLFLLALPLSFLHSSLFLSSSSLRRRILHLHSLSSVVSVRIESLNILNDARLDSLSLLRLRSLHSLLSLPLSLLLLISSTSSPSLPLRRPRRRSLSSSLRSSWWRALLTGLVSHVSLVVFSVLSQAASAFAAAYAGPTAGSAISAVSIVAELWMKSVLEMGMMVTVVAAEERLFGVDAIRAGWEVLAGRRMVGWVVAGAIEGATAVVWWLLVGLEDIDVYGGDWKVGFRGTEGLWWKAGLVSLYAVVILWSNVLVASLNCECTGGFKHVADDAYI